MTSELGSWGPAEPGPAARIVFAAPHPDDEVLGAGLALRWWADQGHEIVVVACTDGEGSHARSAAVSPDELTVLRHEERRAAVEVLGLRPEVHRLELPDGDLARYVPQLTDSLAHHCGPDDALLVPWQHDDHPDHRAVHDAGVAACHRTGAALWQVSIWGKVRRSVGYEGRVSYFQLSDDARRLKEQAVAEFTTQVGRVGPGLHDGPVVHPEELDAILDGTEVVLW